MPSVILSDNGVSSGSAGIKTTADSTGALALQTTTAGGTATTAITIDTSQNVGIGTSSPSTYANSLAPVLVVGTGNNFATIQGRTDGPSGATNGVAFGGSYSTNPINGARITLNAEGGSGQQGSISFWTKSQNDNTTQPAERMRIDSSGNLLVGTTTQATGALLTVNGSIKGTITSGTAVASTSGTAIDFTSIPSWVKRITVMFNGVSTNGTSKVMVQIGAGSVTTSGYVGAAVQVYNASASSGANDSTGFLIDDATNAAGVRYGHCVFTLISGTTWIQSSVTARSDSVAASIGSGSLALSGTLDRVRITTGNGTDTFDAGSINILYEG